MAKSGVQSRWRRTCATRLESWWRRAAEAGVEVPLNSGDAIRTLNGQPMTALDRLRDALKAFRRERQWLCKLSGIRSYPS